MLLERERTALVEHARRMERDGLSIGTAGNLSARAGDLVAITPSGVAYSTLVPEMICVLTTDGRPVEGTLAPSSELPLHLAVYRELPVSAVVHTHSPHATALSTVLDELPAIHYLIAELGGPVRVAPYATFGTEELAASAVHALAGRHAALLEAHGTITVGDSVAHAYARSLHLEWLARIYTLAQLLGTPRLLPADEIDCVSSRLDALSYGEHRRGAELPQPTKHSL